MIVKTGLPFFFQYAAFDQSAGLSVAGKVYEVTSGTPVLLGTVAMTHVANGVYAGSYTPTDDTAYLVIAAVYTDGTFATVDTAWAPGADNFECGFDDTNTLNFNYGAYDQDVTLTVSGKVYLTTSGTPALASTVSMAHVLLGVYYGRYAGAVNQSYAVVKTSSDVTRPPAIELFQGFSLATGGTSVDPGENKVFNGHPYVINGVSKVGSYAPFDVEPSPGTSRITSGFAALASLMDTLFPAASGWSRLPNGYRPEENPAQFLRQGWGLALGPANSEQVHIGCVYDLNRGITITIARAFEGLENDDTGKTSAEIAILEDQRRLINSLEQNASLNGTIMYTQYQGDEGLEYVRGDTERFLMVRTNVSFQYTENFV